MDASVPCVHVVSRSMGVVGTPVLFVITCHQLWWGVSDVVGSGPD